MRLGLVAVTAGVGILAAAVAGWQVGRSARSDELAATSKIDVQATHLSPSASKPQRPIVDPASVVGIYRWGGLMNMGVCEASVANKLDEAFVVSESTCGLSEDDPRYGEKYASLDLHPDVRRAQTIYFLVGAETIWFSAKPDDEGNLELETMAPGRGTLDYDSLLREIATTKAPFFCVELPDVDYRTCFSTKDAAKHLPVE